MGGRRAGRETALQILYQLDWNALQESKDRQSMQQMAMKAVDAYFQGETPGVVNPDHNLRSFVEKRVAGVISILPDIDQAITRFAKGWKLHRMAGVDRNILRLGIFELCYDDDIPPRVAINEAVELAKRFGDKRSPAFINGILDAVLRNHCNEQAGD